jgi:hypothetical protein
LAGRFGSHEIGQAPKGHETPLQTNQRQAKTRWQVQSQPRGQKNQENHPKKIGTKIPEIIEKIVIFEVRLPRLSGQPALRVPAFSPFFHGIVNGELTADWARLNSSITNGGRDCPIH